MLNFELFYFPLVKYNFFFQQIIVTWKFYDVVIVVVSSGNMNITGFKCVPYLVGHAPFIISMVIEFHVCKYLIISLWK